MEESVAMLGSLLPGSEEDEAFEEFVRGRSTHLFRHGSAEPYVRRIVVNAAIDWRRAWRRRAEQSLDAAIGMAAADRTGQVADRDALARALAALAPKQRAVLVMRYWEDVPDAEIAEALNCSAGTVRSQASRALARLRELSGDCAFTRSEYSTGGKNHD